MPELRSLQLGTSRKEAPVLYALHKTGSYLIGEYFGAGYYRECLKMAKSMKQQHRPAIEAIKKQRPSSKVNVESVIAKLENISNWAENAEAEGFHGVNTHAFITLWAAQEAGLENVISEIIINYKFAAEACVSKFKAGKYSLDDWPWSESTGLEIAQKLDGKAKNEVKAGGEDIASRIVALMSWFGINVEIDDKNKLKYNEASKVRNIILHRYGVVEEKDVVSFPDLKGWVGKTLPINNDRFRSYHTAIIAMHLALFNAICESSYK